MSTNPIDIFILAVLAISVLYGLYRGFINGILSLAALLGSIWGAFATAPALAQILAANETLVATLRYYTDAASRIGSLDLSVMSVAETSKDAIVSILQNAKLPPAFEEAFLSHFESAAGGQRVSSILSETIVGGVLQVMSFLICFAGIYLLSLLVVHFISYVFELPVLRHLDALVGGLFGFVRGVLLLIVLNLLLPIVLAAAPIALLQTMIADSTLLPLFNTSLIFSLLGLR